MQEPVKEIAATRAAIAAAGVKVCEGISGIWRYHLCLQTDVHATTALCGRQTMACSCTTESWGFKPEHMPTSYCDECERMAVVKGGGA